MIKLSQPKAYGEIKPLHGSTGRPIRCTPTQTIIPKTEELPDCTNRLPTEVQSAITAGRDEHIARDVASLQCDTRIEPKERTRR